MKDNDILVTVLWIICATSMSAVLIYVAYQRKWFRTLFKTSHRKTDDVLLEKLNYLSRSAYDSAQKLQEVHRRLQIMDERMALFERQLAEPQRRVQSYPQPSGPTAIQPNPPRGSGSAQLKRACGLSEAQSFFEEWCRSKAQPDSSSQGWEVSAVVFSAERRTTQGTVVGYDLRDSPQEVGHFFRVGEQGHSTAFLFPHPLSTYSPHIQAIFPSVSKESFVAGSSLLGTLPLTIVRSMTDGQIWECPCPS